MPGLIEMKELIEGVPLLPRSLFHMYSEEGVTYYTAKEDFFDGELPYYLILHIEDRPVLMKRHAVLDVYYESGTAVNNSKEIVILTKGENCGGLP